MAQTLPHPETKSIRRAWLARALTLPVLLWNLSAALPFVLRPERYAGNFELSGDVGAALVRSIGLLFLMWNAPYVPALLDPARYRVCLAVIVAQQTLGLAGETWLALALPPGHPALLATGLRFITFDAAGWALLALAWGLGARITP